MMKKILPDVTVGVDFHTGGAQIDNFPHVRCVFEKKENLQVAEYFNAPFIMNSKFIDKSFRKEAHRQKKNLIVFEGGESFRMDEVSIQEGINGISRLMHGLEMKEYKGAWNEMKYFKQTHWFRAPNSGLFSSIPNRGDYVSKGSPLAILSDPFGEVEKKVVSPYSGYILGINNKPVVNRGDALFNIGVER